MDDLARDAAVPWWRRAHEARRARATRRGAVRFLRRAQLRDAVLIVAFDGWNDAGEAATYALAHLGRQWRAQPFAEIDSEEFYDYTEVRPEVGATPDGGRTLTWPSTSLSIATVPGRERDVVLLRAPEPQLRWPTYCDTVVGLARAVGVTEVIALGAYLSEVTHGRTVPLTATSSVAGGLEEHDLAPSLYEGPTGIVGVLGEAFARAGLPVTSVWASVPCYSLPVSPKAALALVQATGKVLHEAVDDGLLAKQAEEYERRMDELVEDDDTVAAYVARLEELEEESGPLSGETLSSDDLAEEIERYLRKRR